MHKKNVCPPWTPGHDQTSLLSAVISPNSCNIIGLALLDRSLLCIPDALGQTAIALPKKPFTSCCMHA